MVPALQVPQDPLQVSSPQGLPIPPGGGEPIFAGQLGVQQVPGATVPGGVPQVPMQHSCGKVHTGLHGGVHPEVELRFDFRVKANVPTAFRVVLKPVLLIQQPSLYQEAVLTVPFWMWLGCGKISLKQSVAPEMFFCFTLTPPKVP